MQDISSLKKQTPIHTRIGHFFWGDSLLHSTNTLAQRVSIFPARPFGGLISYLFPVVTTQSNESVFSIIRQISISRSGFHSHPHSRSSFLISHFSFLKESLHDIP